MTSQRCRAGNGDSRAVSLDLAELPGIRRAEVKIDATPKELSVSLCQRPVRKATTHFHRCASTLCAGLDIVCEKGQKCAWSGSRRRSGRRLRRITRSMKAVRDLRKAQPLRSVYTVASRDGWAPPALSERNSTWMTFQSRPVKDADFEMNDVWFRWPLRLLAQPRLSDGNPANLFRHRARAGAQFCRTIR